MNASHTTAPHAQAAAAKMPARRLYKITIFPAGGQGEPVHRLINAGNSAQAIKHAMDTLVDCKAASASDVAALMGAGVKVESVDDAPEAA